MRFPRSRTLIVLLGAIAWSGRTQAAAQSPRPAIILVHVADAAGSPVPGADVAILDAKAVDAVAVATTDSAGRHTFNLVRDSSDFRITARKLGYVATIRRLLAHPGDTVAVELRMAAVAAVRELPTVVTRESYRLSTDPGLRDGIAQRCASPLVACIRDSTFQAYPGGDLLAFLNRADGMIPQPDNGYKPWPPKMVGTGGGHCEPEYYVNGFHWPKVAHMGWEALADAYRGFAIQSIEVYRAGEPRPGRFMGDPTCGVIVIWLK